ncbi:potassium channel subfamily K member 16-like [Zootoca vivipara]|uniref:potassium channel subfamily K member 16-like n=1 Tax=Zootoca vivipara TaxID=8524 RepID=UPI0015923C6A|nr:potassium channel subfamily K member 16-like [Zootoca vivipara]
MHMSRAQGTLLLAGLMTYMVMGALIFEILEKENSKKVVDKIYHRKEAFFLNYTSLSPEEVELFIVDVIKSVRKGIIPRGTHPPETHSYWDFSDSFFFVGTMLATIGYGNVCPQTKEGQMFCVIFALFGIPFNLICLNYIGFLVSRLFERCAAKVFGKGKKKTARYTFLFMAVGLLMFLILPSFLFQHAEGWSYHEAIYFTFITLSTIGFGDYLIGRKHERNYFVGYQLLAAVWIVIGLAWIAVLFQLVSSLLLPGDSKASSKKRSKLQR